MTDENISMEARMITSAFELPNYKIDDSLGIVRGISVRSRNLFADIGAGFQSLAGGNVSIYTKLCETTREEAFQFMIGHAVERGANAIIGMRYDCNEIVQGVTEVIAYGTAVHVVPIVKQ
jgi:uncharacterized protein YbjQ (UPF0145 family)